MFDIYLLHLEAFVRHQQTPLWTILTYEHHVRGELLPNTTSLQYGLCHRLID